MLDRLCVDQFVWTPYRSSNIMGQIPNICLARHVDRVMRQFRLQQTIPQDPPNFDKLHKMNLRDKNKYNWPQKNE
ncbi:hypothetical protein Lal_00035284, partial [Lupinus albus]